MPIWLFNPSMPHNDPCVGGLDQRSGGVCGTCRSGIAHAWKVTGVAKPNGTGGTSGSGTFRITDYRGDGFAERGVVTDDNSPNMNVGNGGGGPTDTMDGWLQFPSVSIPRGATILSATLTLQTNTGQVPGSTLNWKLNGSPSSSQPEPNLSSYYSQPRTQFQTTGTIASLAASTTYTFDATTIVQEIVKSGWAVNGSIMLFLQDDGSPAGNQAVFKAMQNGDPSPQPTTMLDVSWTTINADLYVAQFMGDHVLQRSIDAFEDSNEIGCEWQTSIDLSAIGSPFTPGSMSLSWTSVEGDGGGDQWFLQLNGLPPYGAAPGDVAFYKLNAFAFSPIDDRPFRCLSQNTFWREDLLGGGNFPVPGLPDSLLVQPFWP